LIAHAGLKASHLAKIAHSSVTDKRQRKTMRCKRFVLGNVRTADLTKRSTTGEGIGKASDATIERE
jgi:hypothetical protein